MRLLQHRVISGISYKSGCSHYGVCASGYKIYSETDTKSALYYCCSAAAAFQVFLLLYATTTQSAQSDQGWHLGELLPLSWRY